MKRMLFVLFLCIILSLQLTASQPGNNITAEKKMSTMLLNKFREFQSDVALTKVSRIEYKKRYSSKFISVNSEGKIFLWVTVINNINAVADTITSWGGNIQSLNSISLYVWVPLDKLADLTSLDGVTFIDVPGRSYTKTGSVTSAGDHQLLADSSRSIFSVNGKDINGNPIKVGVISNGMQYYTNSQQSGDLPNNNFGWVNYNGVPATSYVGSEGTAMMEIIHDVAPDAGIYFGAVGYYINSSSDTINSTPLDMANIINTLSTSSQCKIIVDDIGFYKDEPFFEDGDVSQAIKNFQTNGGTYVSAAGNDAQNMYSCSQPSIKTTGNKKWVQFTGSDTALTFKIKNYGAFIITLQWDDAWGNAPDDYNLYLYDINWNLINSSSNSQSGQGSYPQEWLSADTSSGYFNNTTFHIMVSYDNYTTGRVLKNIKVLITGLFSNPSGTPSVTFNSTSTGQIYGHTAAPNVISVAAYSASNQNSIENFSSRGPSLMFTSGNPANESSRNTPTITATDGVETYVGQQKNFDDPFYGTSAAAPHVAAIAALYYSRYPAQTASQLFSAITSSAKSIGGGTGDIWNLTSGYGKISAYDALVKGLTTLNSPQVTSNIAWNLDNITGTATIAAGKTVTIDANYTTLINGTVTLGDANSKILVYGTLVLSSTTVINPATGIVIETGGRVISPNMITVTANQLDENNNSFGILGHWVFGQFDTTKTVPYTFPSYTGTPERLRGQQYFKSGTTQKFQLWNGSNSRIINPDTFKTTSNGSHLITSQFKTANNATVQELLDGGGVNGTLNFVDPWLIDTSDAYGSRNKGMLDWYRPLSSSSNNLGTGTSHMGVFLGLDPSHGAQAYYSVRVPVTQTINGFTSYFQSWSTPGAALGTISLYTDNNGVDYWQAPVVFDSAGATVTANYKAHLGTGSASLANTKNQRRILWGTAGNGGKCWVSVYESMGDIWMTMYDESGNVIVPETRINTNIGAASNPTISNTVNFGGIDYDRAIIGWLERNYLGAIELHLQSINFQAGNLGSIWGWTNNNDPNRQISHAILNGLNSDAPICWGMTNDDPTSTARPVLTLSPNGNSGFVISYAYETSISGKGIVAGQFQTTSSFQDLYSATLVAEKVVTTDNSARLPAIAALDTSHIFIYYATGSYSTLKLSEFNYATSAVNNLTLASGDAIINSIQVATNKIMDTRALVADVTNYSVGAYGGQTVDYFYSGVPMYGYAPPVLRTKYNSLNQPSVMSVDLSHSINSYTPVDVVMNLAPVGSYLMQYRYQLNGSAFSTSVGSNVAGTFLREKASTGTDSVITLVKTSTTPAGIVRYPATGGGLQKESATDQTASHIITSTKSVRLWHDKEGNWHKVIFNFDTLQVDILRDQEKGNTLCAVRFAHVPKSGSFVSQADSLESSVSYDLEREGKVVKSFGSSFWNNLSAGNIPGIQNGDVVHFNLPGNDADSVWGYEEVSYVGMKDLNKENADQMNGDISAPTNYALDQNYPNPFNPSTIIHYEIPNDGMVTLKIYNELGKEIKTLVNQFQSQGRYDINFNASNLASGVYFYQLKAGDYSSIKKMVLLK